MNSCLIEGHEDIAQFLVDKNANLDFIDFIGMTPLHYAAENGEYIIHSIAFQLFDIIQFFKDMKKLWNYYSVMMQTVILLTLLVKLHFTMRLQKVLIYGYSYT